MSEPDRQQALRALEDLTFWAERMQVELQMEPDAEELHDMMLCLDNHHAQLDEVVGKAKREQVEERAEL